MYPNVYVAPSCSLPAPKRPHVSPLEAIFVVRTGRALPARRRRCRPATGPPAERTFDAAEKAARTRSAPTSAVSLFHDLIRAAVLGKTAVHARWSTLSESLSPIEKTKESGCVGIT